MNTVDTSEPALESILIGEVTKEQAGPQLEQLRAARLAGRVHQGAYLARADYLATVAGGGEAQAPNLSPTTGDRLEAQLAEAFTPGQPHEFKLPRDPMQPLEGDRLEFDTQVRQALTDLKVPVRLGGPIVEGVEGVIRKLAPLSAEDRQAHVQRVQGELRAAWGADYDVRVNAVLDFVVQGTAENEVIGELLDAMPWVLSDVAVMERLWSVVDYGQSRGIR